MTTPSRRRAPSRPSLLVLIVVLACTGVLSWLCYFANERNEHRLLNLQTKQTATLLQVIVPTIETPLASAAEIAATSNGDSTDFRNYMQGYVGGKGIFVSASLWRLDGTRPNVVAQVGATPHLGGRAAAFLPEAARSPQLHLVGPLDGAQPRLGYAYASADSGPKYIVYAESALPANRYAPTEAGSPFADLNFALYLGRATDPAQLLESNVHSLPLHGSTATVRVPFGDSTLTLVASAGTQLGGGLLRWLWWIIAIFGVLLAAVAALTTENLVRRRRAAERLTGEVAQLYAEQRSIAETLQHALLPQRLPEIGGLEIAARYLPGVNDVEIGGDWYDAVPVDENCCFVVVGDVSGRGVGAGAVMASLNFAIRGFISEGHPPATILDKLTRLLDVVDDKHFATVLCAVIDISRHEITVANAGHLPPLLVTPDGADFLSAPVGPPIGVRGAAGYRESTVRVPAGTVLLAYTDGLVERRGESLDEGMDRLKRAVSADGTALDDLLGQLVSELLRDGNDDDTAVLGVRWRT